MGSLPVLLPFAFICRYLDGELLYSWMSRLHALNARHDPSQTLLDVFGISTIVPSLDLPGNLEAFISTSLGWGPFTSASQAASDATLYPYFTRFMSPERRADVLQRICRTDARGLKTAMGLIANRFRASTMLKSCLVCDKECLKQHGCMMWLRIHQLPGVDVCPIHSESLVAYHMQSEQVDKQLLIARNSSHLVKIDVTNPGLAQQFATLSLQALQLDALPLSNQDRAGRYLEAVAQLGFRRGDRTDWERLAGHIGQHYQWFEGMACRDRLLSSDATPLRWIQDICLRPERSLHPICHILMAGALFGDIAGLFAADRPGRSEDTSESIEPPAQRRCKRPPDWDALIEDVSLSCCEVARQSGISTTTVVQARKMKGLLIQARPKFVHQPIIDNVVAAAKRGRSVNEIVQRTLLSSSTVYRILKSEHLKVLKVPDLCCHNRQHWETLVSIYAGDGTKAIRARCPAIYAWLYRNDRDWLRQHSPKRTRGKHHQVKVDWHVRDMRIAQCIEDAAKIAVASGRTKRLSQSFLLRSTHEEWMIRRNLHKLPLVSQALHRCTENDVTFCERRRRTALLQLGAMGILNPPEWMIQKASGIRPRP